MSASLSPAVRAKFVDAVVAEPVLTPPFNAEEIAEIIESPALYRQTPMIILSANLQILYWSPGCERLSGYDHEHVQGQPVSRWMSLVEGFAAGSWFRSLGALRCEGDRSHECVWDVYRVLGHDGRLSSIVCIGRAS